MSLMSQSSAGPESAVTVDRPLMDEVRLRVRLDVLFRDVACWPSLLHAPEK